MSKAALMFSVAGPEWIDYFLRQCLVPLMVGGISSMVVAQDPKIPFGLSWATECRGCTLRLCEAHGKNGDCSSKTE